jgi:hypothetical protein
MSIFKLSGATSASGISRPILKRILENRAWLPRVPSPRPPWRISGARVGDLICPAAEPRFEEARELYADEWLGFSEAESDAMLERAGFPEVSANIVDKEPETPQCQSPLGIGKQSDLAHDLAWRELNS